MARWGFNTAGGRARLGLGALLLLALLSAVAVFAVGASAGTSPPRLASVQRAPAAPLGAKVLGAPAASAAQSGYVVLKPRDEQALQRFIAGVTKPHSSQYHHYLAKGQFASKFGPSSSTIAAVKSQLIADGLKVTGVARDGLLIGFTGTTSTVESAFATKLERYTSAAGITGEQTTKAISLPASISRDVAAVIGLNTLVHPEADLTRAPKSAYAGHRKAKTAKFTHYTNAPSACSDASSDASLYGGLTDDQIANAYGATPLYGAGDFGAGVNVGVYELEPFSSSDLQTFDECYFGVTQGDAMAADVSTLPVDGGQPNGSGSGESILDIEDVSAMAPSAHIDVYEAPNSSAGSLDEYAQMVNDDNDQIITSSWGLCEQDLQLADPGAQQAEDYIFQQAAAQGQTVLSAAGDTGSDTCNEVRSVPPPTDQNPLSVEDPASQPYVLAVGGTTIQDADPANYDETVWNDGALWGGGGGGLSMTWEAPSWQQQNAYYSDGSYANDLAAGNQVESDAQSLGLSGENWSTGFCANNATAGFTTSTPCRGVPDVSGQADEFTGAVTIYSTLFGSGANGWITIGGTSSATPIWAAMLALVDGSSACNGTDIGFANPLLYAVGANPSEYAVSFHDITTGNNDDFGFDDGSTFPAQTGYDLASGLGSPVLDDGTGNGLALNLCNLATGVTTTPLVTGLSPSVGSVAGGGTLTITGSGFSAAGGVQAVTIGADVIPGADVTVVNDTTLQVTLPAGAATLAPASSSTTDLDTGTTYVSGGSITGQDGAGLANVVVTMANGTSSPVYPNGTNVDQFTYVDTDSGHPGNNVPTVTSVSPYAGAQAGGNTLTLYGADFSDDDTVTIGGVSVDPSSVTDISPTELQVVAPAFADGTTDCATQSALVTELSNLGNTTDTDPGADNICQTQIVVTDPDTTPTESSDGPAPLPTYFGTLPLTNQDGLFEVPQGYELTPVSDEYDYVPTPTITGVSTQTGTPADFANADPGSFGSATPITITGTGLNYQTLNYLSFGDPTSTDGQDLSLPAYADGTTLLLSAPSDPNGTPGAGSDPDILPVTANSLGGQSPEDVGCTDTSTDCITYAGIPAISGVQAGSGPPAVPNTGGIPLTINGSGLADVAASTAGAPVEFVDALVPYGVPLTVGTQYQNDVVNDTEIDTETLDQNPGIVDTQACSESGCSAPTGNDEVLLYPPGDPVITSIQTASGPALGGTLVTINGENLGCVTSVSFGSTQAEIYTNAQALLDCGSSTQVEVVSPPGTAGASVPITLSTVESDVTGDGDATSPTEFTYDTANPSVPSSVSFPSTLLGQTSSELVTLSNPASATQPLYPEPPGPSSGDIGAFFTGANASDYSITDDGCAEATLNPGQTCAIQVQFAPSALGTRTATLNIPWNYSSSVATAYGLTSQSPDFQVSLSGATAEPTNTVTTPGTTTTKTVTKTVTKTCTITVRWRWVTVKVHGKKKREHKKFTTRSRGCPKIAKKAKRSHRKHGR